MARSGATGPPTLGAFRAGLQPRLAAGIDRGLSAHGRVWRLAAGREPVHVTVLRVGRWVLTGDLAAPVGRPARWSRALARLPGVRLEDLTLREVAARGLSLA
jgi:hypothetical protein